MAETVSWMYSVRAKSGPSLGLNGVMDVEAYEKLSLTLANGDNPTVAIAPGTWADVQSLIVSASSFGDTLTLTPDGGATIPLDGPLVLIGAGPVALLGAGDASVTIENTGPDEVSVEIFVARDATP